MPDLTMGLARAATSVKASQLQNQSGIRTLKMAMDTQSDLSSQLLEELNQAAYAAVGKGQNVDLTV